MNEPLEQVRVPADQYRNNLAGIYDVLNAAGIPVVFLTAPTSHYRDGVPDYLVDQDFARDRDSVKRLHRQYNDIVRQVAARRSA